MQQILVATKQDDIENLTTTADLITKVERPLEMSTLAQQLTQS